MKFIIFAMGFTGALARPSEARTEPLCPAGLLYSVPQCCTTGVLGVADLDCKSRQLLKATFLISRPRLLINLQPLRCHGTPRPFAQYVWHKVRRPLAAPFRL